MIMNPTNFQCTGWLPVATDAPGCALTSTPGLWNFLKLSYDDSRPDGYQVEVWQAIDEDYTKSYGDSSLNYKLVAHWNDFYFDNLGYHCLMSQFYMDNNGSSSSWAVKDVEICATLSSAAVAVATPVFAPDGRAFTPGTVSSDSAANVVVSCTASGAHIVYTTDGSVPTSTNGTVIASGGSVRISSSTVLTAIAFKSGMAESTSKSSYYWFPVLNRPQVIQYSSSITLPGDLSDWPAFPGSDWTPLDQTYEGDPVDVPQAYYDARWGADGQKLYVAVRVNDTAHVLVDAWNGWNTSDHVEIYVHTTGEIGDYDPDQETAQQVLRGRHE